MTLVGQQDIFAIEWSIDYIYEKNVMGNVSYIAGGQRIDGEGTGINWAVNGIKQYFLPYYEKRCNLIFDFSDIPKEDVFDRLFSSKYCECMESDHNGCCGCNSCFVCPEQYRDFYSLCKKQMIEAYYANKIPYYSDEQIRESIIRGDDYSNDYTLGNWIHGHFWVAEEAGDALLNYHIYLVRDIAKQRERLIWKRYERNSGGETTIPAVPLSEAVMPIGYFKSVHEEFVEVASKEIENALLFGTIPNHTDKINTCLKKEGNS